MRCRPSSSCAVNNTLAKKERYRSAAGVRLMNRFLRFFSKGLIHKNKFQFENVYIRDKRERKESGWARAHWI